MFTEKSKNPIYSIFLTIFLDMMGIGLILPVLAPLILKNETGLFSQDFAYSSRTIVFGILMASFMLSQFISNPIIGSLSDMLGRRKVLIYSIIATAFGYLILTFGIIGNSLILIFLGRIIPGIASGNITIAYSSLADISDETNKTKNFGMVGMAFGLGFIIGPFLGGELTNHNLISWFHYYTAFVAATILSLINLWLVFLNFPETLKVFRNKKIKVLGAIHNINKAFSNVALRNMFLVIFINAFGFAFFTQFFIVLLLGKFGYKQDDLGIFYGYLGICVVFMQGVVLRLIAKKMKPEKIVLISLPVLFISLIVILIPDKAYYLFLFMPFVAFGQSLSYSSSTAVISNLGGENIQGEILGITQSMNALAQAIPALIGGYLVAQNYNIPSIVASGCSLLGWILFFIIYKMNKKEKFVLED